MKIKEIYYQAKDGKLFTDPLECEAYEKTIGIMPGSVAELIHEIEKNMTPEQYVNAIVYIGTPDGLRHIYMSHTCCVDDQLESFVNIKDLTQEQRYIYEKVSGLLQTLKEFDKDAPCQYFIIWSDYINMEKPGTMANHNPQVWSKKSKKY